MEWYRSGHNELHWNCSSRETGPWVRIPLTPPEKKTLSVIFSEKSVFFVKEVERWKQWN